MACSLTVVDSVATLAPHGCTNRKVEVIAFGKSSSGQLREAADDFIDISENPRQFLLGYRGGGGGRWIPGFASSESEEGGEEEGGEDPAVRMSGQ